MNTDHDIVANLYRSLARNLPDQDAELAIQALAAALRDLSIRHFANPSKAKALSVAALREAFAAEVGEIATAGGDAGLLATQDEPCPVE